MWSIFASSLMYYKKNDLKNMQHWRNKMSRVKYSKRSFGKIGLGLLSSIMAGNAFASLKQDLKEENYSYWRRDFWSYSC